VSMFGGVRGFALLSSVLVGVAVACAAGCAADRSGGDAEDQAKASVVDRFIIGEGVPYPADKTLSKDFATLQASQVARRKAAWAIIKRATESVGLDTEGKAVPRFQTWYGKDEILPMYERILTQQTPEQRAAHTAPTDEAIADAFQFLAKRTPGSNWEGRLAQRRAEIAAQGTASLGGNERILMSPALVAHLFKNHDALMRCVGNVPSGDLDPPTASNFAPCVGAEFPADAVLVKARWIPELSPLATFDTSARALEETITAGEWGEGTGTANPDDASIYTMRLPTSGTRVRLAALHVATKELRDWAWVTMFWSDAPNVDFGSDRPAEMTEAWANYKMCAVVDYDEGDDGTAQESFDPTLRDALAATRKFGPRTWCSNPYLEGGKHNSATNCIGCHQHGGTNNDSVSLLEGPNAFPDGARARTRKNFPADYTFVTNSGLGLAAQMKVKFEQFVPPAPPPPVVPPPTTEQ
jgi:hypothetical protein